MIRFTRFCLSAAVLPVALALLLASAVRPAGAADIRTSLGGFVKFQYGFFDRKDDGSERHGARTDAEVHLDLSATSDTGIEYGGRIQLARAAKPRDNGTYLWARAAWGAVRLGDYGGAAKELTVSAPTVGIGQIDGDFDAFAGPSALLVPYKLDNDDSTKITYLSPQILGVRAGLSYTPELGSTGAEVVAARTASGIDAHRDVGEAAISYTRDIGEATLTSGASYVFGGAKPGAELRDLSGYGLGAKLAWDGLTVGGGYVYDGKNTLPVDPRPGHALIESVVDEINFGLTYEFGKWGVGSSWARDERAGLPTSDLYALGAVYHAARGLTFGSDFVYFVVPRGQSEADGYVVIVESALHF
jgi:predicted porin